MCHLFGSFIIFFSCVLGPDPDFLGNGVGILVKLMNWQIIAF